MTNETPRQPGWVYVVDDNADDRRAAAAALGADPRLIREFDDGAAFLQAIDALPPGCVILDVRMPGVDGLSVMETLSRRRIDWPVVMMSNQASIPIVVRAMQRGARHFVEKPCDPERLREAVAQARMQPVRAAPPREQAKPPLSKIVTPREMDVLRLLLAGRQNKSIAYALGISERTVEVHRARLMRRLQVRSFAELIRKAVEHGAHEDANNADARSMAM
ncbi:MAG: response regulator [Hyphomicrobiales bacterium]|nr:response regulator [Hyphomicrobiales bacterium]